MIAESHIHESFTLLPVGSRVQIMGATARDLDSIVVVNTGTVIGYAVASAHEAYRAGTSPNVVLYVVAINAGGYVGDSYVSSLLVHPDNVRLESEEEGR